MPFHDRVYYPYTSDTQGTHSSAGIPSLLNSPLSHPVSPPVMTPSGGGATVLPFKFRPRRESVDWRRINAVDVDMVVSRLDVDALQEHMNMVTFCTLDGERCQRCQSPVDPALVKLLQLAQLTVEWLLHCQEFLALNLRGAEEQLANAGKAREQLLAQQKQQEDKAKMLLAELKQRKKVIRTQQSMLTPRIISSHKCLHCDKSFLNSTFLQNHVQRRHPDEYESQLCSDSEKKSQIESLKLEISSLKEQVVQQQQALQAKTAQEKEQLSLHKDLLRELDRFKAEEMARMERKIEDSRDGMRREMEFLYTRNIQALNEANQNHSAKHEKPASPVHPQAERDLDIYKEMHTQAIQKLQQQLKKKDKQWEARLQEMTTQHECEKNTLRTELSRMHQTMSDQQEQIQRLEQDTNKRLQEKDQTISAQKEQIKNLSLNPPTKEVEVPVVVSVAAPELKSKRAEVEQPVPTLRLDPIQELSEEEKELSSISDRRTVEKKSGPVPEKKQRVSTSALKRNPNVKRERRPEVEQAVIMRLEDLGVKPDQSGLKNKQLTSILAKVHLMRDRFAKGMSDYWHHRQEIATTVEQKLGHHRRGSDPAPETQARSRTVQALQIRPRSSSLPSRATQVMSGPAVKQPKTPQPTPRTKTSTQPKTSTPLNKGAQSSSASRTPRFSSSEECDEEDTDMEVEQDVRTVSPQRRTNQAPPARHSTPQQSRWSNPVTKTTVTVAESDDDEESSVSELQEIDLRQLQRSRDQNSHVDRRSFSKENKISDLARKTEKHFAERVVKKPAGAVSILPERKDVVQELTYSDVEESSDWVVSSLEDRQEGSKPAQSSGPLRRSLDSQSTSVWGTSTGKGPKSGLTEAGTGSTLKSSLCSLSDISDSEDISDK